MRLERCSVRLHPALELPVLELVAAVEVGLVAMLGAEVVFLEQPGHLLDLHAEVLLLERPRSLWFRDVRTIGIGVAPIADQGIPDTRTPRFLGLARRPRGILASLRRAALGRRFTRSFE